MMQNQVGCATILSVTAYADALYSQKFSHLLLRRTHVRTSPYYPQSNGKLERFHKTIKGECIRVKTPLSLHDARKIVAEYIEYYNTVRLHSAIGYIAPADKLNGREKEIFEERDRKREAARQERRIKREQQNQIPLKPVPTD